MDLGYYQGNFAVAFPPLLILVLSSRGVILWVENLAAAVYLSITALKLKNGVALNKVSKYS